jgi:hypothetical protein
MSTQITSATERKIEYLLHHTFKDFVIFNIIDSKLLETAKEHIYKDNFFKEDEVLFVKDEGNWFLLVRKKEHILSRFNNLKSNLTKFIDVEPILIDKKKGQPEQIIAVLIPLNRVVHHAISEIRKIRLKRFFRWV